MRVTYSYIPPIWCIHNGTTQTTERIVNPESEYLKELPSHLRSFEQVLSYYPNQVYIGNATPDELAEIPQPWHDKECPCHERYGQFGQMMPQEEFLLLLQACDVFELVQLDKNFVAKYRDQLAANPIIDESIMARVNEGVDIAEIERLVAEEHSEGLYDNNVLVGCVNRAHDIDVNLSAHTMLENLVSKASCVVAILSGIKNAGINKEDVEYVIDCCEEACGDMNQRGGGNFAKAAAEIAGLNARHRFRCPWFLRRPRPCHGRGRFPGRFRRIQDRCCHRRRLHRKAGHERQGPCQERSAHP